MSFIFLIFFFTCLVINTTTEISEICLDDNICSTSSKSSLKKMSNTWSLFSWKDKPIVQNVVYNDKEKYENVIEKLGILPPLVHQDEVKLLYNIRILLIHFSFIFFF